MPREPNRLHSDASAAGTPSDVPTRERRLWRRATIAIGIAGLLLATSVGVAFYLAGHDDVPMGFVEVYLTDLPADIDRLDVQIAGIAVGSARTPLPLEMTAFDLLQLRGPSGALRLARGMVPLEENPQIRITFQSATAHLGYQSVPLEMPEKVLALRHDYGLSADGTRSILFDINVDRSVRFDGPHASFEPFVDSVYVVTQGRLPASSGDEDAPVTFAPEKADFKNATSEPPNEQRLENKESAAGETNPFAGFNPPPTSSSKAPTSSPPAATDPPAENETDDNETENATEPPAYWLPDAGDSYSTPVDYTGTILGWFVQFLPNASSPEAIGQSVNGSGAELVHRFVSVPAVYVLGTPLDAENLSRDPYVTYVEPLLPVQPHLSSSKTSMRIPELYAPTTGLKDAQGRPIDGRGVGVAVVDTGIDGLHPDLAHRQLEGDAAPVRANYKVASVALVDMIYTDTTSGHGTHVAGIVAGRGTKDPAMKGVAPGATLYGFGIGELANTLWPNQAFDWIVQNGAKQTPPIRIVTNSWGTVGSYDPNSLTTKLVEQMVAKGMVVVFSAGNGGGDGGEALTSRECRIPQAGVLCVAWYDDLDVGSRSGKIDPGSSRGLRTDRSTWPDLSAPGSSIRSARTPFGWVTGVGLTDYYVTLQGTSMAAPHVAGTAALMLQAKPTLSPTQVDSILKGTALKYTDGGAYDASGSHLAKGFGLVDAYAAVAQAKVT